MGLFDSVTKSISNVGKSFENAANSAVGNLQNRGNQFIGGGRSVLSGDLTGLRDMASAGVNLGSDMYATSNSLTNS